MKTKVPLKKLIKRLLGITIGSIIQALGIVLFLSPNKIAPGGFSGLSIIIYHLTGFPVGTMYFILNLPLFLIAGKKWGFNFIGLTLYGTIVSSFFIDFLSIYLSSLTSNPLLASIYGGVLVGIGVGIVFKNWGSTGGTDLLGQLIYSFTGLSFGTSMFILDTTIVLIAGIVFKALEYSLYGMLALFISSKVVDAVQEGFLSAKTVFLISDYVDKIKLRIMDELERGVTEINVRGAYTGVEKKALICVVHQREISKLKEIIHEEDPKAFVIIGDAREVIGEGFIPIEEAKR
ncbi:MAG: YitT family protein [Caldisericia bacterium]|nr:YitT family protein [Caldisericia bacterium]